MGCNVFSDMPTFVNWSPPQKTRRATPRAKTEVRVKVVHTSHQKRRLEVFITGPVMKLAGWLDGAAVRASFVAVDGRFFLRLKPSHGGLLVKSQSEKSETARVTVSCAPIHQGLCAPIRSVSFEVKDGDIAIELPSEWAVWKAPEPEGTPQ